MRRASEPAGSTLQSTWLCWIALLSWLSLASCGTAPPPRSLILIVVDTLRYDHLGAYGYSRETTPWLDQFARDAIRVERAYAAASWTLPSVASILTGVHPRSHGARSVLQPISDEVPTLAEILRNSGYATAGVVSNAHLVPENGFGRGFDSYDYSQAGDHERVTSAPVTDLAIELLDSLVSGGEPFFLFVHYFDPHYQYRDHPHLSLAPTNGGRLVGDESMKELTLRISDATAEEIAFLVGRYDEEIQLTDAEIGRLLDRIRHHGLEGRAITTITADHGEEFGDHGQIGHGQLYEEVLRVPLLMRIPGESAGTSPRPVSLVALAPTLLELLGIRDAGASFSDPSFAASLRGEAPTGGTSHFAESFRELAVVRGRYKLIRGREDQLFDLQVDPQERRNLVRQLPAIANELRSVLRRYQDRTPIRASPRRTVAPDQREMLRQLGYVDED